MGSLVCARTFVPSQGLAPSKNSRRGRCLRALPLPGTSIMVPSKTRKRKRERVALPHGRFAAHQGSTSVHSVLLLQPNLHWCARAVPGEHIGSFECYFFNPTSKACSDVATKAFLEGKAVRRSWWEMTHLPWLLNSEDRFLLLTPEALRRRIESRDIGVPT